MKKLHDLFRDLGLSDSEAKAYRAILQLGSGTVKPIADAAGLPRTSIYNFIDRLVEMGIVGRSSRRGRTYYHATNPEKLLELQRNRAERLEAAIPDIVGLFQGGRSRPKISYFEGPEEVRTIVREEVACKNVAHYIWTGRDMMEMVGGTKYFADIDRQRLKKGVRIRTIRFREKDIKYSGSSHGEKFLRDLRFAPPDVNVSMGMGIYDTGKVGFFSSKQEGFGILIESEELVGLMWLFHQLLWVRSTPARPGEG